MTISKRQKTQYNHFCKVRNSLHDLFTRTKIFQLPFNEYLELKKKMYSNHPSMAKRKNGENRLSSYYRGCLDGIEETLFGILQTEYVEWLHYYESPATGKIKYTSEWVYVPRHIRQNKGLVKSNHFWKNPRDPNNPKPWGVEPKTF